MKQKYFLLILLSALIVLSLWSVFNPFDYQVWLTEYITSLFIIILLCILYPHFKFSNTGYFIAFLWCVLQIIGAHYSFERVPFDWVTKTFSFERNHFDRLAHFIIGCNAFLISEILWHKKWVTSVKIATAFGIITIMAVANIWEIIEWIYADIDSGEAGAAFLGSQGDIWDAQKDMLMDTIGGFLGSIIFYIQNSKINYSCQILKSTKYKNGSTLKLIK